MAAQGHERGLRVLHAIHDFLPRHWAGSEIYAAQLCRALAARHHVTVVCADYNPAHVHGRLTWRLHDELPVVEITNNWVCATFADTYRAPLMSARLDQVLQMVQPHVVHVHNLLNLSFDLPAAARARGIPVVATLHDYTLVCASGGQRIHRAESHVCRTIDTARCARCFVESPFYTQAAVGEVAATLGASSLLQRAAASARRWTPGLARTAAKAVGAARRLPVTQADIVERLAKARVVFDQVDVFVSPSRSLAREFVALGLEPSKIRVSDNGMPPLAHAPRAKRDGPLRIGFVGTLVWHKGVHVLLDAVRRLPQMAYEVQVHGELQVFPDYVADLQKRAEGLPVRFLGGFESAQTAAVYREIDLLVVPSLWLENSPLVIHEAFQAGVPVVGSNIGGIADLISDSQNGRLFETGSADALANCLQDVIDNRSLLAQWAAQLPTVKTITDDARDWERIYSELA
jgi:glycosyltransferase involved in cell wall biosynthesis